MKGVNKQYIDEMFQKFGYRATWEPSLPISLGDIGIIEDNTFTRISSLKNENIEFKSLKNKSSSDLTYSSKGGVKVSNKSSAEIESNNKIDYSAKTGVTFEFMRENAIYFSASENTTYLIDNLIQLKKELITRLKNNTWEKEWVVVTELIKSEKTTIFISNEAGSRIEFSAKGNIDINSINSVLFDNSSKLVFHKGINTKIVSEGGLTPLFKVKGLSKHLFKAPSLDTKSTDNSDILDMEDYIFEDINPK